MVETEIVAVTTITEVDVESATVVTATTTSPGPLDPKQNARKVSPPGVFAFRRTRACLGVGLRDLLLSGDDLSENRCGSGVLVHCRGGVAVLRDFIDHSVGLDDPGYGS